MFFSVICLTIISVSIRYASSCASLGWAPREYQEWEKALCRQDLTRCAWHLCAINGHRCDDYLVQNTILPELRCKLLNQCQVRTDKLGAWCSANSDCNNSNYRCWQSRCVHKNTVPVPYPSSTRRCNRWDSECGDADIWKCIKDTGRCVRKSLGRNGKDGAVCQDNSNCAIDYTCISRRCRFTARKDITVTVMVDSGSLPTGRRCNRWDSECNHLQLKCDKTKGLCIPIDNGGGGRGRDGASCEATPQCDPDYTCINLRCKYTAGKGVKLTNVNKRGSGKAKHCNRNWECHDIRKRCDTKKKQCVWKNNNYKPYREGKTCTYSHNCGPDYVCESGDCVLGDLA